MARAAGRRQQIAAAVRGVVSELCLGSDVTLRRSEIGVRRVLGACVTMVVAPAVRLGLSERAPGLRALWA